MTYRMTGLAATACRCSQLRWIRDTICPRYCGSQKFDIVFAAPEPPPPVDKPASFEVDPVSLRACPGRTASPVVGGAGRVLGDGEGCLTIGFGVDLVACSTISGGFGAGGRGGSGRGNSGLGSTFCTARPD